MVGGSLLLAVAGVGLTLAHPNAVVSLIVLAAAGLVVGTWANGAPDATRATAFEVTRDKRIVWAHFPAQDRNMMTVQRPPLK